METCIKKAEESFNYSCENSVRLVGKLIEQAVSDGKFYVSFPEDRFIGNLNVITSILIDLGYKVNVVNSTGINMVCVGWK